MRGFMIDDLPGVPRWHAGGQGFKLQLLTGRQPSVWNGRAAFLPATPYHENHEVQLLPGLPAERGKAILTLADAGAGALALRHSDIWLGHITGRPDLVTYIGRIVAAGLPPTARVRIQQGCLLAQLADQGATIVQLSRLGTNDLPAIRRQLTPTGRWARQRCGRLWQNPRHPGRRWYDLVDDDGPHVCPNCLSYSLTHPCSRMVDPATTASLGSTLVQLWTG
jgi:hypothetical protein